MDEEIVVPPEIAGLFEESDNQVKYCLVMPWDIILIDYDTIFLPITPCVFR